MLVAVSGFGSIWTRRVGRDPESVTQYSRDAAFYNTTGVLVGDEIRARSRVYGVARFNGSSGFAPHNAARMLNRVFECDAPCMRSDGRHVLFRGMIAHHPVPDCYLVAIREEVAGWIAHESTSWMAPECFLISFSESNLHQEAMLLMPPFAWVAGSAGVVVLQPDTRNPASAQLRRADG